MPDYDGLKPIVDYLLEVRGFDFSGYHRAMLTRRIEQRLAAVSCEYFHEYLYFIERHNDEIDKLLGVLTINVSQFFRDPLTFELLADRVLPTILQEKARQHDPSLRIWSAGCAMGEEPYSVAILVHELLQKEGLAMNVHIFATDIDEAVLAAAATAVYAEASIANIKYRLLDKYFTRVGEGFRLLPEITEQVSFSLYDMLDKKHCVPPASIFGNFDLVLCRNLLIYFNTLCQETIFAKLHHALANHGCLILGEAEAPTIKYQRYFKRQLDFSPIYWKG